jgi:hypothetical protein
MPVSATGLFVGQEHDRAALMLDSPGMAIRYGSTPNNVAEAIEANISTGSWP